MTDIRDKIPTEFKNLETYIIFKWLKSEKLNDVLDIRKQCIKSEHPLVEFTSALENWFENDILPPDGEIPEPFESLIYCAKEEIEWWELAKVLLLIAED